MERQKQQFMGTFVLIGMLLLAGSPVVQAEPGPDVLLREVTDEVLAEIRKDPEQLKDVARVRALTERFILPHIDFQVAAQWVLGKYWRTASGQQRMRFAEEFRQLLRTPTCDRSATTARTGSALRRRVVHLRRAAWRSKPRSSSRAGPPVHPGFRLHRSESDWLVYDISVEGISLVATHRSSFAKEIHDKGLDSLIDRLASMNADTANDKTGNAAPPRPHPETWPHRAGRFSDQCLRMRCLLARPVAVLVSCPLVMTLFATARAISSLARPFFQYSAVGISE